MSLESFEDKKQSLEKKMSDWLKKRGAEDGPKTCRTSDGTKYITVVSGGTKAEGECFPIFCGTPAIAAMLWMREVEYLFHGDLWVRQWPGIERIPFLEKHSWDLESFRNSDNIPVTWLYSVCSRLAPK